MFKALLITQDPHGCHTRLTRLSPQQLPERPVQLRVLYSSLNYKDALAISQRGRIVRQFPMVPGIDLAGEVISSRDPRWQPGDKAILTGWGIGERHWGGLAQMASAEGDWLTPLPASVSPLTAMAIGTAGLTAMLAVKALEQDVLPEQGPVLVTGASGGVGSYSVWLLAQAGYQVTAATGGGAETEHYLKQLKATEIISRHILSQPAKPLGKETWAGAIDTAGSHTLANVLASVKYAGKVVACGMAQGLDLPASVAPFILRGVCVQGIDSVLCPAERRQQAWQRLAGSVPESLVSQIAQLLPLSQAIDASERLLNGEIQGRVVIDCG